MSQLLDRPEQAAYSTKACAHCGLPAVSSQELNSNEDFVFCCHGCAGAYQLIHSLGLEDYYALRANNAPSSVEQSIDDTNRSEILTNLESAGVQVNAMSNGLCSVRLSVDGLHCAACTWLIERMQPTIPGLQSAQVRMSDRTIELIYDPVQTQPVQVARKLERLGYSLSPWTVDEIDDAQFLEHQRDHWFGIALATFFAANAMWIGVALYAGESTGISAEHELFLRWVGTVLAVLAVVFPGRIFFTTAWQAIRTKTPHVDIPVAISLLMGVVGSVIGSARGVGHIYFDSLASLILLLRIGRYIQFRAQYRTNISLAKMLRWNTATAVRMEPDGKRTLVPANRLNRGDLIEIKAGETVPADGLVISGSSCIDTSLLNGENLPVPASQGDLLVAGTTNVASPITLEVTASGADSRVGQLMELVRNAASHRTESIQAADRISKWFVIVVLLLAIGTWATWATIANAGVATQHTMALLTIACPCALALAAPLVLTVALGRAARRQIWIRDGACLERLAKPGMMWFDKTGTLTSGKLQVVAWHGDDRGLAQVFALESLIQHPIAQAICRFAKPRVQVRLVVTKPESSAGKGAQGTVDGDNVFIGTQAWLAVNGIVLDSEWLGQQSNALQKNSSVVWVATNGMVSGMFEIVDPIRPEACDTLRSVTSMGWKIGILSGDRQEIVDHVSTELKRNGIEIAEALGGQSPEDKWQIIRDTKATEPGPCAMVGDGVNDAAALSLADIGIAIRGGSSQALAAAPIFLANGKISSVADLLKASKRVVRGIRNCFIASLIYNTFTLSLAMTGWIHPLIAAILMPISGITVLAMAMSTSAFAERK